MRSVVCLILILLLYSCTSQPRDLLVKYTPKDFNCFYERNFSKNRILYRWNDDVHYYLKGDTLPGDRQLVSEIAQAVNCLNIPISISETFFENKANLIIQFETGKDTTTTTSHTGISEVNSQNGVIASSRIKIPNETHLAYTKRKGVLYHEFMHSLGVSSHVFSTTNSVSTPILPDTALSSDDKKALEMLYENVWPNIYSIEDFEKDFSDVLYHINAKEKLLNLIRQDKINIGILDSIRTHCLVKDELVKFTQPIFLFIENADSLQNYYIEQTINEINSISEYLLIKSYHTDSIIDNFGIHLRFKNEVFINNDNITSLRIIDSGPITAKGNYNVQVGRIYDFTFYGHYLDNKLAKDTIGSIISNSIFKAICSYEGNSNFFYSSEDKMKLKPEFTKLLQLIYSPEIPNNVMKAVLDEILIEKEFDTD